MRRSIISLTPLIDVVFILLVFFMLATSFSQWRTIDLGVAKAGSGAGMKGAILVDIRTDGLRMAGRQIDEVDLVNSLHGRFRDDPAQRVLIKPAPAVELQRAVDLIDSIARAGGTDVSLVPPAGR